MTRLFYHCELVLGDQILHQGYLVTEGSKIVQYGPMQEEGWRTIPADEAVDCRGCYLSPGFIDVHTHGGGGGSFMVPDPEQYRTALHTHLTHGTTTIVPTVLARSVEEVRGFAEIWKGLAQEHRLPYVPGLFFEGPYTSGASGAQGAGAGLGLKKNQIRKEDYEALYQAADGSVIRWMIAPELEGSLELGRYLRERGVIVCMGHSMATYEQAVKAKRNGYSCVIHLFTTMSTVTREQGFRRGGLLEAGLLCDDLMGEIICDGCHLPPELILLAVKCKGYDNLMLVSDSGPFAGTDWTGEQEMLGMKVIIEDGVVKMADRSCFAGSIACGDTLVRTCCQKAGLPLWAAVRMATKTPARHLGLSGKKGEIAVNADADLVLFDEDIRIQAVYREGGKVWEALA